MRVGSSGSNDKEQEESKLLIPQRLLFLNGMTSPGGSQDPLQAGGRESTLHSQVQKAEWKESTKGSREQVTRYEGGDDTGTGACLSAHN